MLIVYIFCSFIEFVTYGTSGKACYGTYNTSTFIGKGPGYVNSCIHSGVIEASGDLPTTWYNYATASAGTIVEPNATDPVANNNPATESICPKGWTMPSLTQAQGIVNGSSLYAGIFNPVIGGVFINGQLKYDTQGDWWLSTAATQNRPGIRPRLYYSSNSNAFGRDSFARYYGFYIRCVQSS